jgi:ectoine hydroxylase-related dioxygenase (phytanoyl-CoA dioxygenase family)
MSDSDPAYYLVRNSAGEQLSGSGGRLSLQAHAGDDCMWRREGKRLICATSGLTVTLSSIDLPGEFSVQSGPRQLPSRCVEELREQGFTVLENVMDSDAIGRLKAGLSRGVPAEKRDAAGPHDGHFWIMDGLAWSADLARAVCHPVALWVLQQYMGGEDIHFCTQPIITTIKPADELKDQHPEDGWHSDYPYHPDVLPETEWPDDQVLGVQFNVCVDRFEKSNAATQFVPGSYAYGRWPSDAFNTGGTRMGEGVHKDVSQMEAPAGAALIYDARMWHRSCDELNVSGEDRVALLNAVAPDWVLPMIDRSKVAAAYRLSDVPSALSEREAADIERLCHGEPRQAPPGMPLLKPKQRNPSLQHE